MIKAYNPQENRGPDAGRIKDIDLAIDMATVEAPIRDGDPVALGNTDPEMAEFVATDASDEVYDSAMRRQRGVARAAFRETVEDKRTWGSVNKPASAGLPTLGKR